MSIPIFKVLMCSQTVSGPKLRSGANHSVAEIDQSATTEMVLFKLFLESFYFISACLNAAVHCRY